MSSRLIGEAIGKGMRSGNIHVTPGYDGEYGKVKILNFRSEKRSRGRRHFFDSVK